MDFPDSLLSVLKAKKGYGIDNLITDSLLVGAIAMALVQVAKEMLPIRRIYQERWLKNWIQSQAQYSAERRMALAIPLAEPFSDLSPKYVESELLLLATNGNRKAFYELPIEQLTAQLTSASQVALDYPDLYKELFGVLTACADPIDAQLVRRPPETITHLDRGTLSLEQVKEQDEYVAARNRIQHQVHRSIDAIQISVASQWKFFLQIAAMIACFVIALPGHGIMAPVIGLLGGFAAPFSYDLTTLFARIKQKSF